MACLNSYINETFMQQSNRMSHICFCSDLNLNIYKKKRALYCKESNSNLMHSLQGYYIQLGRVTEALEDELDTITLLSAC